MESSIWKCENLKTVKKNAQKVNALRRSGSGIVFKPAKNKSKFDTKQKTLDISLDAPESMNPIVVQQYSIDSKSSKTFLKTNSPTAPITTSDVTAQPKSSELIDSYHIEFSALTFLNYLKTNYNFPSQ